MWFGLTVNFKNANLTNCQLTKVNYKLPIDKDKLPIDKGKLQTAN